MLYEVGAYLSVPVGFIHIDMVTRRVKQDFISHVPRPNSANIVLSLYFYTMPGGER